MSIASEDGGAGPHKPCSSSLEDTASHDRMEARLLAATELHALRAAPRRLEHRHSGELDASLPLVRPLPIPLPASGGARSPQRRYARSAPAAAMFCLDGDRMED